MTVIQVTNKVITIYSPKELLLDTNNFAISTSFKKYESYDNNFFFFNFNVSKR